MKYNKKIIFLIACMIIFLLIGAISATKKNTNENASNVDMKDNALKIFSIFKNDNIGLNSQPKNINQSHIFHTNQNNTTGLNSQKNNIINQSNNLPNTILNSTINNESKINYFFK